MAINTRPFRGSEAILTLSSVDSRAGTLAEQIFNTEYNIGTVGRVTGVEVTVQTDLEVFHEIGTRQPATLHSGNINISGRVERAYINGALLRLLMGDLANAQQGEELQPIFNMIIDLTEIGSPNGQGGTKVIISFVRFDDWKLVVPEDDFIMENATFKALRIAREEKDGG
ncbi:MAG: hypothetical protein C3F12_08700 [Candidatus Methylomirabilota bacterium]|nr:hypothetical protein [Candidatus Methylomirabilis sp.]NJD69872.1 hypothetical protein [candidate division NC10 bacterium]PWB46125.1 MAG: hypothetical protein C3F12_08700 [candidate division NC10 bacterium]